jgi:ubiquinol-cytochrome c reductase cytochrome c1 subunit
MREFKILAILVFFTGILYWGVEPFAHSQMHEHVKPADFSFKDVDGLGGLTGDSTKGAELVASNCTACHSIKAAGFPPIMDNASAAASYGVVPPDLSSVGYLYDENFLAAFIKNPAKAALVAHKFVDGRVHPMPSYNWMQPQEIADIVAYLKSIAPHEMSDKEVFADACQRCHSAKYGDFRFDGSKSSMSAFTPDVNIKTYMGTIPPDLSQMIRSRGHEYLEEFINEPGKHLKGTAMPRVGLKKEPQEQVIAYLEKIGDSSKEKRAALGPKFLGYLVIFAIFAWAWKFRIWKDIH